MGTDMAIDEPKGVKPYPGPAGGWGALRAVARAVREQMGASPDTRALLNEKTITIWLDAPIDVLDERTGRRNTRPTLRGPGRRDKILALDAERRAAYAQAHIHVKSSNSGHGDVISQILAKLGERLDGR